MKKVLIIGNCGSGKTTFARKLAVKTELPLVHLDQLYWYGNWEHRPREEFDSLLERELEKPQWILDGNFHRTLPLRLTHSDTVIFFDLPTLTCLAGITKRVFSHWGKTREDMGGNCPEYFDTRKLELYRNVLSFNKQHRSHYYRLLSQHEGLRVIVFKNRRQAEAFLKTL